MKPLNTPKSIISLIHQIGGIAWLFFAANPSSAQSLILSHESVAENEPLYTLVGALSVDGSPIENYDINFVSTEQDAQYFEIINNQLYTKKSLDYERKSSYAIEIRAQSKSDSNSLQASFTIGIENITGKFDTNGVADQEVADKYEQVNVGDFILFNSARGNMNHTFNDTISYPQKILIKGDDYQGVRLTLNQVKGNSPSERVIITNFLGQIRSKSLSLVGGEYWRTTGRYDPSIGSGSKYFRGCDTNESTVDFGGSHGKFGFWLQNAWENETSILCYVNGEATGYEVDHMECADGAFAGLMFKQDSGTKDMNNVYIHHMYVHDTGSEGIYLGSTQPDPQHQFNNLLIENCVFLRTGGEAIQLGQLGDNCVIRNNVGWAAFDWLSPFSRYQDKGIQIGTRQGNVTIANNIIMGGGDQAIYAVNHPKSGITPNGQPLMIANNLFWGTRGPLAGYVSSSNDGVTDWTWNHNYFGYFDFDYDRAYNTTNRSYLLAIQLNTVDVNLTNNFYDAGGKNLYSRQGSATFFVSDNTKQTLAAPEFVNFINESADYPYLLWKRWTARVGEESGFTAPDTKKGEVVTYIPGEVVQYYHSGKTHFYRCLEENTDHEPPEAGDNIWQLMQWAIDGKTSLIPPDDVRLVPNSDYASEGIGLFEEMPIQVTEEQNWAGYSWVDEQGNVNTGSFLHWINVFHGNWIWSYTLRNWLYIPVTHVTNHGAWAYIN